MKIRPVGAEFYADGQTDGWTDMKRKVSFRNFAKAPKSHYFVIQMQLGISCAEFGQMTECNPCCNNYWPAVTYTNYTCLPPRLRALFQSTLYR
jgi:hypothetical protein